MYKCDLRLLYSDVLCLYVVNFLTSLPLQSSRINDQRCSLPPAPDPEEDFFSLIQKVQSKRMDEQRVSFPSDEKDETDLNYKSKNLWGLKLETVHFWCDFHKVFCKLWLSGCTF